MDPSSGDAKTPGLSYTVFQEYNYVMLQKIIVGKHHAKIPYNFLVLGSDGNGGTIVDLGSIFTFMEGPVFELLAKSFEKQMANYTVATDV